MYEWIKRNERLFLVICMICGGVIASVMWSVVSLFALKSVVWLVTFTGYGIIIGFIGGYLYICNS